MNILPVIVNNTILINFHLIKVCFMYSQLFISEIDSGVIVSRLVVAIICNRVNEFFHGMQMIFHSSLLDRSKCSCICVYYERIHGQGILVFYMNVAIRHTSIAITWYKMFSWYRLLKLKIPRYFTY